MIDSLENNAGSGRADLKNGKRKKVSLTDPLKIDRIPPHSLEAEQGVLGCVLLSPRSLSDCVEKLKSGSEMFYDLRHQALYDAFLDLTHKGTPIDLITVQQKLKGMQQLESIGGIAYVASLPDSVPSAANLGYYLDIVREKHILRQMIATCTETVGRAYEHEGNIEALLTDYEKETLAIRGGMNCGGVVDVAGTLDALTVKIQQAADGGTPIGMQTGIRTIDAHIGGMDDSQVIGISAEPSTGKTSLASQIGLNRVFDYGDTVGWFSLETSAETMLTRFICNRQRINSRALRSNPSSEELSRFGRGKQELLAHEKKILICDDSDLTMSQIRSRARRMVQQGAKLLIIDFLQLIKSKDPKKSKTEVVSESAYEVKSMAKELKVPVIIICSLSNEGNLKNSGDIGYSLDVHITLKKKKEDGDEDKRWTVICRFAKGKDCGTATKALAFVRPYYRFDDSDETETE